MVDFERFQSDYEARFVNFSTGHKPTRNPNFRGCSQHRTLISWFYPWVSPFKLTRYKLKAVTVVVHRRGLLEAGRSLRGSEGRPEPPREQ